jgi:ABC-type amino acid transport substrate-binding protein
MRLVVVAMVCLAVGGALGCGGAVTSVRPASSTPDAVREVRGGQADAAVGDYPAMAYAARESMGTLEIAGPAFDPQQLGIAVARANGALHAVITTAFSMIVQNGTYARILGTWALDNGAVPAPTIPPSVPHPREVPQLQDGVLRIGMEVAYPPMEFYDESRDAAGVDVEIANALGQALGGIRVEVVNLSFEQLLPQLEAGQIDLAISSMTITPERSQRALFVPYFTAGSGIVVRRGNPLGIRGPRDLCGHRIAVQRSTVQEQMLRNMPCN